MPSSQLPGCDGHCRWALVTEHGLSAITMSRIADEAGIGRAKLYKYFADLEAILAAWHQRHAAEHLVRLAALRDRARDENNGWKPCWGHSPASRTIAANRTPSLWPSCIEERKPSVHNGNWPS